MQSKQVFQKFNYCYYITDIKLSTVMFMEYFTRIPGFWLFLRYFWSLLWKNKSRTRYKNAQSLSNTFEFIWKLTQSIFYKLLWIHFFLQFEFVNWLCDFVKFLSTFSVWYFLIQYKPLQIESHIRSLLIGVKSRMFIYFLLSGWGKFNQNWFTYLQLMDWPVYKLQVCNLVFDKFAPTE